MNRNQAAALVMLAEAALGTGQTIAAQAEAAQDAAQQAKAGQFQKGGTGPPKKVATAKGEAHYGKPIGTLIIPHEHFIKGQPSHWSPDISQSKWVANYWKDHDQAEVAAHAAVNAGTHRWVQAGDHEVAVSKDIDVHVPKETDLHNPVEVKNAHKVFVKKGQDGQPAEHMALNPDHPEYTTPDITSTAGKDILSEQYKKLPGSQASQKAVSFDGKLAGWVPSTWKVYKSGVNSESEIYGKYLHLPNGAWRVIDKSGKIDPVGNDENDIAQWLKNGQLIPDDSNPEVHGLVPDHGPAKPTVDVGGVPVTKEEIQDALHYLAEDKSTAVKQPLAKKNHPLAAMDYHGIAKAEAAKHPGLQFEAGTKKAHVGKVKLLVQHHLNGRLAHLAKTEAETAVQEATQDHLQAEAEHAQELTPATVKLPGPNASFITVSKEAVQEAIDALEASKSTAIKQTLANKDSALKNTDYWAVIHQFEKEHPAAAPAQHGTKQAHVGNAKALFITALKEKAGLLAVQDQASGHDQAAELYDLAVNGVIKEGWYNSPAGAIAKAAWMAVSIGSPVWVKALPNLDEYDVTATPLTKEQSLEQDYWMVTPQLKLAHYAPGEPKAEAPVVLYNSMKAWLTTLRKVAAGDTMAAPGDAELKPLADALKEAIGEQEPSSVPVQAEELKPQLEEEHGVPAIKDGVYAGDYPPGTKLYENTGGYYKGVYGRDPSGQWWQVEVTGNYGSKSYSVKQASSYQVSDEQLQKGELKEVKPPAAEETEVAKSVGGAVKVIHHGSMDPGYAAGETSQHVYGTEKVFKNWQQAAVYALSTAGNYSSQVFVVPVPGGFMRKSVPADGSEEHWTVNASNLQAAYFPKDGEEHQLAPDALVAAVNRYVQPDSVVVDGKQFKFGYWKNPKGKSYIQVGPFTGYYAQSYKYGTAAQGHYVYHDTNGGTKELTPGAAAKQLAKATEFSAEEPKPQAEAPVSKVANVAVLKPDVYAVWSTDTKAPDVNSAVQVYGDGSGELSGIGATTPLSELTVGHLLQSGALLDTYGTSVVKPGLKPDTYHLLGSEGKTRDQLEQLKAAIETGWNGMAQSGDWESPSWQKAILEFFNGAGSHGPLQEANKKLLAQFMNIKNYPANGEGQRSAVYNLVKELLAVSQLPEGTQVGEGKAGGIKQVKEPSFLKNMPEGISSSKDLFTWTETGNAVPYHGTIQAMPDIYWDKAKDKSVIQGISQQFGGGKVVGTHLSGMSKDTMDKWLVAWKQGDMAAVYELDTQTGKLSPAHPGAPDNTDTHHITWSPLDPHQVPASQDIPGEWSDLTEVPGLPPAEVDNYLIKMGFQHAEYLQPVEKLAVVRAHRQHDQDETDKRTATANERFGQGQAPVTAPLKWTDGLKPAKPYDAYVHDSTPAHEWTNSAVLTFTKDHQDELQPFLEQQAQQYGYTVSQIIDSEYVSMQMNAIQAWQDDVHAKYVAEQSVPVWAKVPTGNLPSHGHEVYKATRTIPYTGEQSTWFVKPAPSGQTYRLEQEHAANLLGRALGFGSAESQLMHEDALGSGVVQAQRAIPGEPLGYYTDMPDWSTLTGKQVTDIAAEHMLDHLLFNDDTSANNMIQRPDGHIAGIDKGRSWGDLTWDSLSGTSSMDSMTQTVYTKLYDAIRSHQLSKELADQAYVALIQKARRIARVPDGRVQEILDAGFANRPGKWGPYGSKQGLIDEVVRRKNNLETDFRDMWAKVYEDAAFGNVKGSDFGPGKPWGDAPVAGARYGTVVFNDKGQVLLREPTNHYGGAHWTFAKGGAEEGESPLQAAVRETTEETRFQFPVTGYVPGVHGGHNYYYLATEKGSQFKPEIDNGETMQTDWVSLAEARKRIGLNEADVRERDLQVLDAAEQAWKQLGKNLQPFDPYQLSGALPDVPLARLGEAPGGHQLYSGFGEEGFLDAVAAAKSHGVPAFFGGRELRDMNVLVWQQPTTAGKTVTHGETYLKGEAFGRTIDWLKAHIKPGMHVETETTYPGDELGPGKPPPDSADRGGVAGERSWYTTIIEASRTVTKHKMDGQYNEGRLQAMDSVRTELQPLLDSANANKRAAAQHYLDLIDQVVQAKNQHQGFAEGQLPRWLPESAKTAAPLPQDELLKLGIKLTQSTKATHERGTISRETGQFEPEGSNHQDPGNWWKMELPDGETIQFGNSDYTGVALSHQGRVRFTSPQGDAASLERIRAALQVAGLDMREAEQPDFELFYWRHLLAILDDRGDGHKDTQQQVWSELTGEFDRLGIPWNYGNGDGSHQKIIDALEKYGSKDPEGEVQAYRTAFAKLTSPGQVQGFIDNGGAMPHLKHFDPHSPGTVGGKPDWYRFDMGDVSSLPMPIRESSDASMVAKRTVYSGGSYSRDALMRVVGEETHSSLGNPYETGGPQYVFTRLNVHGPSVMFSPLTLLRTKNYQFPGDQFGEWAGRKTGASGGHGGGSPSYWNPAKWKKYSDGGNETMISDALSLLDDVELIEGGWGGSREEVINWLKKRGITHIRYMPVEDRIVEDIGPSEVAKVKANWAAHPELLDPLREPSVYVGAAESQVQPYESGQAAEEVSAEPVAPAKPGFTQTVMLPNTQTADVPGDAVIFKPAEAAPHSGEPGGISHDALWGLLPDGEWFVVAPDQAGSFAQVNFLTGQQDFVQGLVDKGYLEVAQGSKAVAPDWQVEHGQLKANINGTNYAMEANSVGAWMLFENGLYYGLYDTADEAKQAAVAAGNPEPPF